ncbi:hypothetical protein SDC9_133029 [bioreactor metagenome]|uniref:Uncharacterized protein n=1 Tax=bioreactor metagenome TaxID=1076179 RepID=A0A645D962_9ZZZZ
MNHRSGLPCHSGINSLRTARNTPSAPMPPRRSHSHRTVSADSGVMASRSTRITKSLWVACPLAKLSVCTRPVCHLPAGRPRCPAIVSSACGSAALSQVMRGSRANQPSCLRANRRVPSIVACRASASLSSPPRYASTC